MKITNKEIKRINDFKNKMIEVLKTPKNEAKKSWLLISGYKLYKLLKNELEELHYEVWSVSKGENLEKLMKECLDVANFAFMIYDITQKELSDLKDKQ